MKVSAILRSAAQGTNKSWVWLMKLMIPISLGVALMQYFGFIGWLAGYLNPLFVHLGLPGSSAIIFLSGALAGTYAGVAALTSIALTVREATILGLMIALCHSLPMECAVNRKTGSSFWKMGVIRIVMAFVCAGYLNLVLPGAMATESFLYLGAAADSSLQEVLLTWAWSQFKLALLVYAIIYALMILQQLLEAYHLLEPMSRFLSPLMLFFGLPRNAAYMWLVGNVLGISYGSAVMVELEERGLCSKREANDVNYHLIMSHSLIEDTLILVLTGVSLFWLLSTRLLFAWVLVWAHRLLNLVVRTRVNYAG